MQIFDVRVDEISFNGILERVTEWVKGGGQHQIVSVNPEGVLLAQRDARYRGVLNRAALAIPDGIGVVWAARWTHPVLRTPLSRGDLQSPLRRRGTGVGPQGIERITGVDLMMKLCELAAQNGWKVYLAGGGGETAKRAAEKLRMKFPELVVVGEEGIPLSRHSHANGNPEKKQTGVSFFSFLFSGSRIKSGMTVETAHNGSDLIQRINEFQPHLLFIALGQPRQELWIDEHIQEMPSVRVAMGVGGAFDFIAGKVPRAPLIMRRMGLEWLWRLFVQPWRFPRIFNATVRFLWLVVKERLK